MAMSGSNETYRLASALNMLKVNELKGVCRHVNVVVGGRKGDLVNRLLLKYQDPNTAEARKLIIRSALRDPSVVGGQAPPAYVSSDSVYGSSSSSACLSTSQPAVPVSRPAVPYPPASGASAVKEAAVRAAPPTLTMNTQTPQAHWEIHTSTSHQSRSDLAQSGLPTLPPLRPLASAPPRCLRAIPLLFGRRGAGSSCCV